MMKENGERTYNSAENMPPEVEEGLVEAWRPKKYPTFHRQNIEYDPRTEELQDKADALRIHNDHYHIDRPSPKKPTETKSWLQTLKEKAWKKNLK